MIKKSLLFALVAFLLLNTSLLTAQWQSTGFDKSTWVLRQAENGNLIAAEDIYPELGGIYISQDEGASWTKATATDYAYTSSLVKDESVYMGGVDCNVAISHDNGETWTNVSFKDLLPSATENDAIYAMEYHNGRVYASVLSMGVVYSEDNGETWHLTDQESLWDVDNPDNGGQWTYSLKSFNGELYNVGAFGIWKYDETADVWSQVDDYGYAGSSLVVNDTFYVAYNAGGIPDAIRYTTDFQNWETMPIPAGIQTTVRILEYYEGAFFMGHVHDAVYYTLDHGETWIDYREEFPAFSPVPGVDLYGVPMNFVFNGETMYCGVFSSFEDVGGVYKAPIPAEVLSIKELPSTLKAIVYPNPASDFVNLQLPKELGNKATLTITDVMSRVQYHKAIDNGINSTFTVPTKNWASGVYLYYVEVGDSKTTGKFLIN
ncbi:T9SS type A sorting domain-containing protein [Aequorivita xiaoshiensis]|uniref:T9SS type A sorting domain-containing protein n=1 Tax=Aequorivita xiaoshiensis TaxID=2874476 RepID=A0A9X1QYJ7_9FLAO|nr:T9SS type A sorting domain-containing protein [Aequorivita xiaoshiensis]MCG2431016.1 T9SS type A sorting domain-containing protein [Aequorivita xiaoshiensis]